MTLTGWDIFVIIVIVEVMIGIDHWWRRKPTGYEWNERKKDYIPTYDDYDDDVN